jgi:hypothetical protein
MLRENGTLAGLGQRGGIRASEGQLTATSPQVTELFLIRISLRIALSRVRLLMFLGGWEHL